MKCKTRLLKLISLVLAGAFLASDLAYSAPSIEGFRAVSLRPVEALSRDPERFEPPLDFSSLKEIHRGVEDTLILHIQDAHSNLSGQENLAKTLDHVMSTYGVSLVLVEGGAHDGTLTPVKKVVPPAVCKRLARRLLIEGRISGEEYLNLTSDQPMKIVGVEDIGLYAASVKSYAALADKRETILEYLGTIQKSLGKLKSKLYPKELLEYERDGMGDFQKLLKLTQDQGVVFKDFPTILKLQALQDKEKTIDFDAANLEQAALLEEISRRGNGEDFESQLKKIGQMRDSKVSQFAFFRNTFHIAKEKKISFEKYPNWVLYGEYLKEFSAIDLDRLLEEFQKVENNIYFSLLTTSTTKASADPSFGGRDPRLIRAIDRYVRLLDTAYRIQMTTREFKLFEANEPDFATMAYLAFINRKLTELGYFEDLVVYKNLLEEGKKALVGFYDSVDRRDSAFLQNAERILKTENQKTAVLITGGYHTAHLKQLMREKGYSWAVLAPLVTSETNQSRYEKLLLEPVTKETRTVEVTEGKIQPGRSSVRKAFAFMSGVMDILLEDADKNSPEVQAILSRANEYRLEFQRALAGGENPNLSLLGYSGLSPETSFRDTLGTPPAARLADSKKAESLLIRLKGYWQPWANGLNEKQQAQRVDSLRRIRNQIALTLVITFSLGMGWQLQSLLAANGPKISLVSLALFLTGHLTGRAILRWASKQNFQKGPITWGPFAYTQNPIYFSYFVGFAVLAALNPWAWWTVPLIGINLFAGILLERNELWSKYGENYRKYAQSTPVFFPRLSQGARLAGGEAVRRSSPQIADEPADALMAGISGGRLADGSKPGTERIARLGDTNLRRQNPSIGGSAYVGLQTNRLRGQLRRLWRHLRELIPWLLTPSSWESKSNPIRIIPQIPLKSQSGPTEGASQKSPTQLTLRIESWPYLGAFFLSRLADSVQALTESPLIGGIIRSQAGQINQKSATRLAEDVTSQDLTLKPLSTDGARMALSWDSVSDITAKEMSELTVLDLTQLLGDDGYYTRKEYIGHDVVSGDHSIWLYVKNQLGEDEYLYSFDFMLEGDDKVYKGSHVESVFEEDALIVTKDDLRNGGPTFRDYREFTQSKDPGLKEAIGLLDQKDERPSEGWYMGWRVEPGLFKVETGNSTPEMSDAAVTTFKRRVASSFHLLEKMEAVVESIYSRSKGRSSLATQAILKLERDRIIAHIQKIRELSSVFRDMVEEIQFWPLQDPPLHRQLVDQIQLILREVFLLGRAAGVELSDEMKDELAEGIVGSFFMAENDIVYLGVDRNKKHLFNLAPNSQNEVANMHQHWNEALGLYMSYWEFLAGSAEIDLDLDEGDPDIEGARLATQEQNTRLAIQRLQELRTKLEQTKDIESKFRLLIPYVLVEGRLFGASNTWLELKDGVRRFKDKMLNPDAHAAWALAWESRLKIFYLMHNADAVEKEARIAMAKAVAAELDRNDAGKISPDQPSSQYVSVVEDIANAYWEERIRRMSLEELKNIAEYGIVSGRSGTTNFSPMGAYPASQSDRINEAQQAQGANPRGPILVMSVPSILSERGQYGAGFPYTGVEWLPHGYEKKVHNLSLHLGNYNLFVLGIGSIKIKDTQALNRSRINNSRFGIGENDFKEINQYLEIIEQKQSAAARLAQAEAVVINLREAWQTNYALLSYRPGLQERIRGSNSIPQNINLQLTPTPGYFEGIDLKPDPRKTFLTLIRESLSNALVEPENGIVDVAFTQNFDGSQATLVIRNENPVDYDKLMGRAKEALARGELYRDQSSPSELYVVRPDDKFRSSPRFRMFMEPVKNEAEFLKILSEHHGLDYLPFISGLSKGKKEDPVLGGGYGNGLGLIQRVTRELGGTFAFESREGFGTMVSITFPTVAAGIPSSDWASPGSADGARLASKKVSNVSSHVFLQESFIENVLKPISGFEKGIPNGIEITSTNQDGAPAILISHSEKHSSGKTVLFQYQIEFTGEKVETPKYPSLDSLNVMRIPEKGVDEKNLTRIQNAWRRITIADPVLYRRFTAENVENADYQERAIHAGLNYLEEKDHALVVMATGTGKTRVALEIVNKRMEKLKEKIGKRGTVLFLVNSREILRQTEAKLYEYYGEKFKGKVGRIYEGEETYDDNTEIIFATPASLQSQNGLRLERLIKKKQPNMVVADEVHHLPAFQNRAIYSRLMEGSPGQKSQIVYLGLTATEMGRLDKASIIEFFGREIAFEYRTIRAWSDGYLAQINYQSADEDILSNIGVDPKKIGIITPGTPLAKAYENLVYNPNRYRHLLARYHHYSDQFLDKRALILAPSVADAKRLAKFIDNPVGPNGEILEERANAITLTSEDRLKDGGRWFDDAYEAWKTGRWPLRDGETKSPYSDLPVPQVVVAVDIFNEGVDVPAINLVILWSDTESTIHYVQSIGRGLRPYPFKTHLVVVDAVGLFRKSSLLTYMGEIYRFRDNQGDSDSGETERADEEPRLPTDDDLGIHFGDDITHVIHNFFADVPLRLEYLYGVYALVPENQRLQLDNYIVMNTVIGAENQNPSQDDLERGRDELRAIADRIQASLVDGLTDQAILSFRTTLISAFYMTELYIDKPEITNLEPSDIIRVNAPTRIVFERIRDLIFRSNPDLTENQANEIYRIFPEFNPESKQRKLEKYRVVNLRAIRHFVYAGASQSDMAHRFLKEIGSKGKNVPIELRHVLLNMSISLAWHHDEEIHMDIRYAEGYVDKGKRVANVSIGERYQTKDDPFFRTGIIQAYVHLLGEKGLAAEMFNLEPEQFMEMLVRLGLVHAEEKPQSVFNFLGSRFKQYIKVAATGAADAAARTVTIKALTTYLRTILEKNYLQPKDLEIGHLTKMFQWVKFVNERKNASDVTKEELEFFGFFSSFLDKIGILRKFSSPELPGITLSVSRTTANANFDLDLTDDNLPKMEGTSKTPLKISIRDEGQERTHLYIQDYRNSVSRVEAQYNRLNSIERVFFLRLLQTSLEYLYDQFNDSIQSAVVVVPQSKSAILRAGGLPAFFAFFNDWRDWLLNETGWNILSGVNGVSPSGLYYEDFQTVNQSRLDFLTPDSAYAGSSTAVFLKEKSKTWPDELYGELYTYRTVVLPLAPTAVQKLNSHQAVDSVELSAMKGILDNLKEEIKSGREVKRRASLLNRLEASLPEKALTADQVYNAAVFLISTDQAFVEYDVFKARLLVQKVNAIWNHYKFLEKKTSQDGLTMPREFYLAMRSALANFYKISFPGALTGQDLITEIDNINYSTNYVSRLGSKTDEAVVHPAKFQLAAHEDGGFVLWKGPLDTLYATQNEAGGQAQRISSRKVRSGQFYQTSANSPVPARGEDDQSWKVLELMTQAGVTDPNDKEARRKAEELLAAETLAAETRASETVTTNEALKPSNLTDFVWSRLVPEKGGFEVMVSQGQGPHGTLHMGRAHQAGTTADGDAYFKTDKDVTFENSNNMITSAHALCPFCFGTSLKDPSKGLTRDKWPAVHEYLKAKSGARLALRHGLRSGQADSIVISSPSTTLGIDSARNDTTAARLGKPVKTFLNFLSQGFGWIVSFEIVAVLSIVGIFYLFPKNLQNADLGDFIPAIIGVLAAAYLWMLNASKDKDVKVSDGSLTDRPVEMKTTRSMTILQTIFKIPWFRRLYLLRYGVREAVLKNYQSGPSLSIVAHDFSVTFSPRYIVYVEDEKAMKMLKKNGPGLWHLIHRTEIKRFGALEAGEKENNHFSKILWVRLLRVRNIVNDTVLGLNTERNDAVDFLDETIAALDPGKKQVNESVTSAARLAGGEAVRRSPPQIADGSANASMADTSGARLARSTPATNDSLRSGQAKDAGLCVTGDTLLPILRATKILNVPIREVKAGNLVFSLNETIQTIEPRRIKGLLDMGVKPVYKLTTASGRSIKTTANHPYYAREKAGGRWIKVSELKIGDEIGVPAYDQVELRFDQIRALKVSPRENSFQEPGFNTISRLGKNFNSFISCLNDFINILGSFCAIFNQTTANIFSLVYWQKSSSFVTSTWRFFMDKEAIKESWVERGARLTSKPSEDRKNPNSTRTFSSRRNLGLRVDNDVVFFGQGTGVFQGGQDVLGSQRRKSIVYSFNTFSGGQHFQDLPNHDPRTLESEFSMANIGIRNDVRIDDNFSHKEALFFERYHALNFLSNILIGQCHAASIETLILWDPIVSIEPLGPMQVYDIEVEGTHNFIGNGIFAHNTYIASPAPGGTRSPVPTGQAAAGLARSTPAADRGLRSGQAKKGGIENAAWVAVTASSTAILGMPNRNDWNKPEVVVGRSQMLQREGLHDSQVESVVGEKIIPETQLLSFTKLRGSDIYDPQRYLEDTIQSDVTRFKFTENFRVISDGFKSPAGLLNKTFTDRFDQKQTVADLGQHKDGSHPVDFFVPQAVKQAGRGWLGADHVLKKDVRIDEKRFPGRKIGQKRHLSAEQGIVVNQDLSLTLGQTKGSASATDRIFRIDDESDFGMFRQTQPFDGPKHSTFVYGLQSLSHFYGSSPMGSKYTTSDVSFQSGKTPPSPSAARLADYSGKNAGPDFWRMMRPFNFSEGSNFKAAIRRVGTSSSIRNFIDELKLIFRRGILDSSRIRPRNEAPPGRDRGSIEGSNLLQQSLAPALRLPEAQGRYKPGSESPENTVSRAESQDSRLYNSQSSYPSSLSPANKYNIPQNGRKPTAETPSDDGARLARSTPAANDSLRSGQAGSIVISSPSTTLGIDSAGNPITEISRSPELGLPRNDTTAARLATNTGYADDLYREMTPREAEEYELDQRFKIRKAASMALEKVLSEHGRESIKLLDLASGPGLITGLAAERGVGTIVALDDSKPLLAENQKRIERLLGPDQKTVRFVSGDMFDANRLLLEPDGQAETFDVIVIANTLFYFDRSQQETLLNLLKAHLKPGGQIVMLLRTFDEIKSQIKHYGQALSQDHWEYKTIMRPYEELLSKVGYSSPEIELLNEETDGDDGWTQLSELEQTMSFNVMIRAASSAGARLARSTPAAADRGRSGQADSTYMIRIWRDSVTRIKPENWSFGTWAMSLSNALMSKFAYGGWIRNSTTLNEGSWAYNISKSLSSVMMTLFSALAFRIFLWSGVAGMTLTTAWPDWVRNLVSFPGMFSSARKSIDPSRETAQINDVLGSSRTQLQSEAPPGRDQGSIEGNNPLPQSPSPALRLPKVQERYKRGSESPGSTASRDKSAGQSLYTSPESDRALVQSPGRKYNILRNGRQLAAARLSGAKPSPEQSRGARLAAVADLEERLQEPLAARLRTGSVRFQTEVHSDISITQSAGEEEPERFNFVFGVGLVKDSIRNSEDLKGLVDSVPVSLVARAYAAHPGVAVDLVPFNFDRSNAAIRVEQAKDNPKEALIHFYVIDENGGEEPIGQIRLTEKVLDSARQANQKAKEAVTAEVVRQEASPVLAAFGEGQRLFRLAVKALAPGKPVILKIGLDRDHLLSEQMNIVMAEVGKVRDLLKEIGDSHVAIQIVSQDGKVLYADLSDDLSPLESQEHEVMFVAAPNEAILAKASETHAGTNRPSGFMSIQDIQQDAKGDYQIVPLTATLLAAIMVGRSDSLQGHDKLEVLLNNLIGDAFKRSPSKEDDFRAIKEVHSVNVDRYLKLAVKAIAKLNLNRFLEYARMVIAIGAAA